MKSADDHMLNGLQHYRHSLQLLDLFAGFIFPHVQNQFNKERKINSYLKKLRSLGWQPDAMNYLPA